MFPAQRCSMRACAVLMTSLSDVITCTYGVVGLLATAPNSLTSAPAPIPIPYTVTPPSFNACAPGMVASGVTSLRPWVSSMTTFGASGRSPEVSTCDVTACRPAAVLVFPEIVVLTATLRCIGYTCKYMSEFRDEVGGITYLQPYRSRWYNVPPAL